MDIHLARPNPMPKDLRCVVKVQLSTATSFKHRQILIYNETRSLFYCDRAPLDVRERMGDQSRLFFNAHSDEDGRIVLGEPTEWQDW